MTLSEFCLDRIAEDEATALAAATREGAESWHWVDSETDVPCDLDADDEALGDHLADARGETVTWRTSLRSVAVFPTESGVGPLPVFVLGYAEEVPVVTGRYLDRFDAARILAECEAKRRIVERHSACDDVSYGDASTCPDMRDLAAVYADHRDYDEAWRP
ncbi:MAG: DUF6221 family protein [Acidimicrobiales bacterium]